jgi:glycerol-3-phosphate dehydrogenase (NAD(P)+)
MKAAILGSGSWGTAFGCHLCGTFDRVTIWGIEKDQIDAINTTHTNPLFFKDYPLPENLAATLDLQTAVGDADIIFVVLPSQVVRSVMKQLHACSLKAEAPVVSLSKGLELSTLKRLSEVLQEEIGTDHQGATHPVGVLLGPSHAEEVIREQPTALVLSGSDIDWFPWQTALSSQTVRVYTNRDLMGVEISSGFKNVIAIAVGLCDGLGLGDNTRGAVMTRGLKELSRLGSAMGGEFDTFYGLSGVGDMITTCTSRHSRNRNYGEAVSRSHQDPESLQAESLQVVEGVVMTQAALKLSERHSIELPITKEVHNVLFSGKAPMDAIRGLMERDLRSELD